MVYIQLNIDVNSKNPVDKDPAPAGSMLSPSLVDRRRGAGATGPSRVAARLRR